MTVCNMSIEAGARAGMIAPDETTFAYLKGRPHAPKGADWDAAVEYWRSLRTDDDATFDREVTSTRPSSPPFVTWGTNPAQGVPLDAAVPDPAQLRRVGRAPAPSGRCTTWTSRPNTPIRDIPVDTVFLGSCTNGRIEDLRAAAEVIRGPAASPTASACWWSRAR